MLKKTYVLQRYMKRRIKDIQLSKRPQERLIRLGPQALSDIDLLAIILRSGTRGRNVLKVARDVLSLLKDRFENITIEDLCQISGIGPVKACKMKASIELSRRYLGKEKGIMIQTPEVVQEICKDLRYHSQEHCVLLTLDSSSHLIARHTISVGILNASLLHPREVFAQALSDRAHSIILVHNHPSGRVEPSRKDILITKVLEEAGKMMGINLRDHIIVAEAEYFSFLESDML